MRASVFARNPSLRPRVRPPRRPAETVQGDVADVAPESLHRAGKPPFNHPEPTHLFVERSGLFAVRPLDAARQFVRAAEHAQVLVFRDRLQVPREPLRQLLSGFDLGIGVVGLPFADASAIFVASSGKT